MESIISWILTMPKGTNLLSAYILTFGHTSNPLYTIDFPFLAIKCNIHLLQYKISSLTSISQTANSSNSCPLPHEMNQYSKIKTIYNTKTMLNNCSDPNTYHKPHYFPIIIFYKIYHSKRFILRIENMSFSKQKMAIFINQLSI